MFGLFISPITRPENFQPRHVQDIIHRVVEGLSESDRGVVIHSTEEDKPSMDLGEKVKVLCWVMTGPSNHQTKVGKVSGFQSLVRCLYRPDT